LHGPNGRRDLGDGADRDADAGGVHNAYAHSDARDGHANCCSNSDSNRDGHGDYGSQPGPDRHGESKPEQPTDGNSQSSCHAES
jgi:hypothetical protein